MQTNLRSHLKDIKPAVLVVGGWFDAENLFGALETFKFANTQSPLGNIRLVMGPWQHGIWVNGTGESHGNIQFGEKTGETFHKRIEFPFFSHYLKEAVDPQLPKAMVYRTGANVWHQLGQWPPSTEEKRLYLHEGGKLSFTAPTAVEQPGETFRSDPARPVPYLKDITTPKNMVPEYMTSDQRFAATRPDVLVYQSEPLAEDLTLAGPLNPELFVSTTGTDADWVVKVIDVFPNDFQDPRLEEPLVTTPGAVARRDMGGYQMLVRGEVMAGRFRYGLDRPSPFHPGVPSKVAFKLNDIFHTFRKGHRLMIQIQSTWFPLMTRNPQTFLPNPAEAKPQDFKAQTHTVFHMLKSPSSVRVGVWTSDGEEK